MPHENSYVLCTCAVPWHHAPSMHHDTQLPATSWSSDLRLTAGIVATVQQVAPSLFSDATKSLSIVVPAFNEEQRIAPMLDETLGCTAAHDPDMNTCGRGCLRTQMQSVFWMS